MSGQLAHDAFAPRSADGHGTGVLLALLVHALLIVAIAFSVDWRSSEPEGATAELWSSVPQAAAPRAAEPPPPPVRTEPTPPPPRPEPPVERSAPPPPPPPPPQRAVPEPAARAQPKLPDTRAADAKIALERAREEKRREEAERAAAAKRAAAEREEARREEAERRRVAEREKQREQQRLAQQREREQAAERAEQQKQAQRERAEQLKAEQRKLEQQKRLAAEQAQKKADAERVAAERAKVEEAREAAAREKQRADTLARLQQRAGSGEPDATGTAARSSGPSAGYAGRIKARIKPNIVFTGEVQGNPVASIEVRVAPDGTIVGRKVLKSSGNAAWDEAVLRAIEKTEVLPKDVDGRIPANMAIDFRPRD